MRKQLITSVLRDWNSSKENLQDLSILINQLINIFIVVLFAKAGRYRI